MDRRNIKYFLVLVVCVFIILRLISLKEVDVPEEGYDFSQISKIKVLGYESPEETKEIVIKLVVDLEELEIFNELLNNTNKIKDIKEVGLYTEELEEKNFDEEYRIVIYYREKVSKEEVGFLREVYINDEKGNVYINSCCTNNTIVYKNKEAEKLKRIITG